MPSERDEITHLSNDRVAQLLLRGEAETVREVEESYLDSCLPEVVRLQQSGLSDEELGRHPLMRKLRAHGSRGWEEAVEGTPNNGSALSSKLEQGATRASSWVAMP